jgi:DNA repair protein RecN (Recombination protein N)
MLELKDIADTASELVDTDISDPEIELDKTQSRLDTIARLKRKYGETVSDVLKYKDEAKNQLAAINGSEARIKELKAELAAMVKKATQSASRLTEKRTECAKELSKQITEQLRYLDLENAEFKVAITPLETENGVKRFSANGCDSVEFLISTNPGEPCKSLSRVASGGELSRVMLALKTVLADSDRVSTLIFDEIDTGVSGKTSQKIGIKLLQIGKGTQVFSITHSAQIAAMGDTHYKISKKEVDGRNETSVTELCGEERVDELSRIMGGINITKTLKETASEMLKTASSYRI